jgi:hypothetical protein
MTDPITATNDPTDARRQSRQKGFLLALAIVLLLAGFVVLLVLKRIPLPMRLAMSFGDFVAASALLLLLRQKFSGK